MNDAADTKARIEALRGRLVPVAKAAALLAAARDLEALGTDLAREEAAAAGRVAWPRDMNDGTERPSEWGKDGAEDARE